MIEYNYKLLKVTTRFIDQNPIVEVIDTPDGVLIDLSQYCQATNQNFVSFAPTPVVNSVESSFVAVGIFKETKL
jgi:hypothetical protein